MKFDFDLEETNLILGVLAQQKYIDVYQLIAKIHEQVEYANNPEPDINVLESAYPEDLKESLTGLYNKLTDNGTYRINITNSFDEWLASRGNVSDALTDKLKECSNFMTADYAEVDGRKLKVYTADIKEDELEYHIDSMSNSSTIYFRDIYKGLDFKDNGTISLVYGVKEIK